MSIRFLFCVASCFLFCLPQVLLGQELKLEVPIRQEARIGEEIRIVLHTTHPAHYSVHMHGQPQNAILDGLVFKWTPSKLDQEHYLVTFQLKDSTHAVVDETNLSLHVIPSDLKPYLVYSSSLSDTIMLVENKMFSLSATIKSRQHTDPRNIVTYFTFNENSNLRSFDSCQVSVQGDQLIFHWTPSNREALQEYLKFRITLVDSDQSIYSTVLNFHIQNINQAPHFLNELADTIYFSSSQGTSLDFSAIDPDNDPLHYDYSPKLPAYSLQGTTLLVKPDREGSYKDNFNAPVHLTVTVSDQKNSDKRSVTLIRSDDNTSLNNSYIQPVIGDFTKKVFSEGDSVLTYLNISNNIDLKEVDISYSDLTLPPGIKSLAPYLVFEKAGSYIKVYSKTILPYSLVDRDYNYNISVLLTSKIPHRKPAVRVLVLTVENRPDPKSLTQQKDSLLKLVDQYLSVEHAYQLTLEKVRNRIHRPWWKNVAIATGTLSGVLSLVQIENPDKTVSVVAASISLISILVTNIPSLSEKTLAQVDEKIANSKSRSQRLQEKQNEFRSNWEIDMEQRDFDKMSSELRELVAKSLVKRDEDICVLIHNKKIHYRIKNIIKPKPGNNYSSDQEELFKCRVH